MSALRIETLGDRPEGLAAFEHVREALGAEAGGPEPVAPEATRQVAWRGDVPVARVAFQVVSDLHGAPGSSGLVSHYEAVEPEAGIAVLRSSLSALTKHGVARALGPMNGSTWGRYRWALRPRVSTAAEDPPPFLTEPWNPARYPEDWVSAGFAPGAHYESRIDEALAEEAQDMAALAEKVRRAGIRVRPLDLDRFDQELARLFALSLECFADNLYYTPIDAESFRAQYQKIRPLIDPELVLIAEDSQGRAVGFQFAFQDLATPLGSAPRAIVKTVATAPAARGMGLGGHMLDLLRRRARAIGCASAIHALMHVSNLSMKMSARHRTRVFRRYALYQWTA